MKKKVTQPAVAASAASKYASRARYRMPASRFIIFSNSVAPAVLTDILGIAPSQQWKKGQRQVLQKSDGSVRPLKFVHKANGWKMRLSAGEERKDLDAQVRQWLKILVPKKRELMKIRKLGCQMLLDCWSVGGSDSVSLSPEMLSKLADLGVFFDVTFYAAEETPNQSSKPTRDKAPRS